MSVHPQVPTGSTAKVRRKAVLDLNQKADAARAPQVWLTAYTTPIARLLDPHCDVLLVGDSLGMVLYGFETTLPVTLDMMIQHGAAVMRGAAAAMVVVDLPFGAYQASPDQAFRASARILAESGAQAVKLEGGQAFAETVRFLTQRGVPVVGHIGLTPQSVHTLGGFKARGRAEAEAERLRQDALAIAEAGAFSLVLEATVEPLARAIVEACPVPVIGIGASAACDGQVLVVDDLVGLAGPTSPKFVRRYAEIGQSIGEAAAAYAGDVRARRFPGAAQTYAAKPPLA